MWMIQNLLLTAILASVQGINRPVYKLALTQKGFAQFLQYDLEAPPIREFTFCIWLRFFDLSHDQSIFTYVASGNNRVVRLWLDSGGQYITISLNGRPSSSTLIDITKDTWRHICVSYQSDFGAWALYIDGQIASCEAAQRLYGFVLPGGGSVIIGYGTSDSGVPNGLEGEAFGANMILISTIERNYTIRKDPQHQQKRFHKNKLSDNSNMKYIVLSDLSVDTIPETTMATKLSFLNTTKSYLKFKTPFSEIEHDVGLDVSPKKSKAFDNSNEKEILDFSNLDKEENVKNKNNINFWNLLNEAGNIGKFKGMNQRGAELSSSGTQELPNISEYEVPPPPTSFQDYVRSHIIIKNPVITPFLDTKKGKKIKKNSADLKHTTNPYEIPDIETPPPPDKNSKVYGQWTSSQFANSVLNYIKNFNHQINNIEQRRVPPTIPLMKLTDSFPYASDLTISKLRPPLQFQRRNFLKSSINIHKRDIRNPQINVEILEDDLRAQILQSHAKTNPQNIEIINRGQMKRVKDHRFYRDLDNQLSSNQFKINLRKKPLNSDLYKSSSLMTILPFLKSSEYFVEEHDILKNTSNDDMYTKSFTHGNKWHNVKSYNNDLTPRRLNLESGEIEVNIDKKILEVNKKYPSINLKYIPDNHKIVKTIDDIAMIDARALAMEISNYSNTNTGSKSILQYNHGFLPTRNKSEVNNKLNVIKTNMANNKRGLNKDNFNKNVKIGNALNEWYIIGNNEEQNRQSFIGGDEKIPDINKYRSDMERDSVQVPPSLGPTICKNVELYDRFFYVQPDGSVDITHVVSPVKERNMGIQFVLQNYKICSLEESIFERNPLLFIHWNKTPVRLFGGAYPKKTTDLCGFF